MSIASESGARCCDDAGKSGVEQFSFSRLLKLRKVSAERVCMFREFHTLGAATGKAREENTVVDGGCCSNRLKLIVDFLSAGICEDYWEGTPCHFPFTSRKAEIPISCVAIVTPDLSSEIMRIQI